MHSASTTPLAEGLFPPTQRTSSMPECLHVEKSFLNAGEFVAENELIIFTSEMCADCGKVLALTESKVPMEIALQL